MSDEEIIQMVSEALRLIVREINQELIVPDKAPRELLITSAN
jgi:hypothetical protein